MSCDIFQITKLSLLKIFKKSGKTASEASYVYILSGQSSLKIPKMLNFGNFIRKPESCGQTVLPDWSILEGQKLVINAKNETF